MSTIISGAQNRVKDTYATSEECRCTVRANGEEPVQVIDENDFVYPAGITAPTVAATLAGTSGGTLAVGFYAYVYVYASTTRFPFVDNAVSLGGSLAPRSNPSPVSTAFNVTGATNTKITATLTKTNQFFVDQIWVFRTLVFTVASDATTAAAAGQAFYVGAAANLGGSGTITFIDDGSVSPVGAVEYDNYVAPQFQFVFYHAPYFWGWGNFPLQATCSLDTSGNITITDGTNVFSGRDGQSCKLDGIVSGGYNGAGGFYFQYSTATTGYLSLDVAGLQAASAGFTGSTRITIQGYSNTLYRSKPFNPFSWGFTQTVQGILVPQQFALRIGGGQGTAIGVVPGSFLLKLDTEQPSRTVTLNLVDADTDNFASTQREISDTYSVTSHWSQFNAASQNGWGNLWGVDMKNRCIISCNGFTVQPVSGPIFSLFRNLTRIHGDNLFFHGFYDAQTETNCIYVKTNTAVDKIDYLLYQHAPSGFWGFVKDFGVIASLTCQDNITNENITLLGTNSGIVCQGFKGGVFNNALPSTGTYTGTATSATTTTITMSGAAFNTSPTDGALIGNWCLVTDATNGTEQWARISAVTATQLTFNLFLPFTGTVSSAFNPAPVAGSKFYIGVIECSLRKYFDFSSPSTDKSVEELWASMLNVDSATASMFCRFYRELAVIVPNANYQFTPTLDKFQDTTDSTMAYLAKTTVPTDLMKTFGVEFFERGYNQFTVLNYALKLK